MGLDSLGNQVINFLDLQNKEEASKAVCEYLKMAAENEGKNLAPNRETAVYYANLGLQAYALWTVKQENYKYRQLFLEVIEKGVDLYFSTGHRNRMRIIEDMSNGQRTLKELIKKHFTNAIDEYLIEGQRLDIYLPDENVGIEYDGLQHYEFCPAFHKSEEDFEYQKRLDREKERKCIKYGITLIRIRFDEEITIKTILKKIMEVD